MKKEKIFEAGAKTSSITGYEILHEETFLESVPLILDYLSMRNMRWMNFLSLAYKILHANQ